MSDAESIRDAIAVFDPRALAFAILLVGCGHDTLAERQHELPAGEQRAVAALLAAASVRAEDVHVGAWGSAGSIGIERGHVVSLGLRACRLERVPSLAALGRLRSVRLRSLGVRDASALCPHAELREIDLSGNALASLAWIEGCARLHWLDASGSPGITPPPSHPTLSVLVLRGAGLADARWVAGLPALETLSVGAGGVRSLVGIEGAPRLGRLGVGECALTSIEAVRPLSQLRALDLRGNGVRDLSPLRALPLLEELHVGGNPIDGASIAGWRPQLRPTSDAAALALVAPEQAQSGTSTHGCSGTCTHSGASTGSRSESSFSGGFGATGSFGTLEGCCRVDVGNPQGVARITVRTRSGRVRVYAARQAGYAFAEAGAGQSAEVRGGLDLMGTTRAFTIETLGGPAHDVRWELRPAL